MAIRRKKVIGIYHLRIEEITAKENGKTGSEYIKKIPDRTLLL